LSLDQAIALIDAGNSEAAIMVLTTLKSLSDASCGVEGKKVKGR